ncbi:hypothetical protein JXA32_13810 [Candidatus Sumerlaeota bacterium]|nr:hypothetical protein [Candidatus Sumerlaeota bacterium]
MPIIAICLIFGIPIVAIICGSLVEALKVIKGESGGKNAKLSEDETRLIQELHQGLLRMEKRIEALETILLEDKRR